MQHYVITPGFLSYTGVIIVGCLVVAFYVAPRYGKKSMMVYLTICSTIGGLSVVATQGLGSAIVAQIGGEAQFNQWFLYVLFVFVIGTLLTEIIYLNVSCQFRHARQLPRFPLTGSQKALNLFNAAMVTPTYYVYFTSSTIVASTVLFQGLHGTAVQIIDMVMGFLVICSGVVLLQLAKSAKDVPDAKVFSGDLDQVRTVAEVEEPEYEPRADTIRGGAGIVRAMSKIRTKRQVDEIKRIHDEMMEPIGEDEEVQWDGLRRRKTVSTQGGGSISRRKTIHPPLGMTHFPDDVSEPDSEVHPGFFGRIGRKPVPGSQRSQRGHSPVPLDSVSVIGKSSGGDSHTYEPVGHTFGLPAGLQRDGTGEYENTAYKSASGSGDGHIHFVGASDRSRADSTGSSLAPPAAPPHGGSAINPPPAARRQFSFQNVFSRHRSDSSDQDGKRPISRGAMSFNSRVSSREYPTGSGTTEEERLGLVQGDSQRTQPLPKFTEEPEEDSFSREEAERQAAAEERRRRRRSQAPASPPLGGAQTRDPYDDSSDDSDGLYDAPLRSPEQDFERGGRGVR